MLNKIFGKTLHNLCLLDVSVLIFLIYFNVRLIWAPPSLDLDQSHHYFIGAFVLFSVSIVLCRGELLKHPRARGIVHRLSLLLSILGLYLVAMRPGLAALKPTLVDAELVKFDRLIFGEIPALLFDSIVTPALTEWFAFFYFSYFFIVVGATIPTAFFGQSSISRGLVLGSVFIVCVGHICYTLVPGRGPYVELTFEHQLMGGFFWNLVQQMVVAQGALLDIFPSLHTAIPTFVTLYIGSCRSRWNTKKYSFITRIPWFPLFTLLIFSTLNIIIATLYLRWHYAVDVIAGLLLAVITTLIVKRANPSDAERKSKGRHPIFEPCLEGLWFQKSHSIDNKDVKK